MLRLFTGTPGAGKTLFAVKLLCEEEIPKGREIWTNIDGFTPPDGFRGGHILDPTAWDEFPDGSLVVIDEAQKWFAPMHHTKERPHHIAELAVHRHRGFDIWFITQMPDSLDTFVRHRIERHAHLHRAFGLEGTTVREWEALNPTPAPAQGDHNVKSTRMNFPRKYYDYYKSASMHIVEKRLPWRQLAMMGGGLFAVCLFLGFAAYQLFSLQSDATNSLDALPASVSKDEQLAPYVQWRTEGCNYLVIRREGISLIVYDYEGDSFLLKSPREIKELNYCIRRG